MKSKILWFTGLSGAGKTTLANIIFKKLKKKKFRVKKIDGDLFRKKNKINKFNKKEIINNNFSIIRYISGIQCKYDYIIVSVISPLRKTRVFAYKKFGKDYFEILTKCKLKTLIDRDTKKLYEKAKKNIIKNLIGFNSKIKYENTSYKKIIVRTDNETINESTNKILRKIYK
jgi:adenylylsulfate kinase